MKQVSFEEIGAVVATFEAASTVEAGTVVKMSGDSQVSGCAAGERFCGVALSNEGGFAGVQVSGFAKVGYTGAGIAAGYQTLTADGAGGVRKADTTGEDPDTGMDCLVVSVDSTASKAVILL